MHMNLPGGQPPFFAPMPPVFNKFLYRENAAQSSCLSRALLTMLLSRRFAVQCKGGVVARGDDLVPAGASVCVRHTSATGDLAVLEGL